jgi:hypothetical protein
MAKFMARLPRYERQAEPKPAPEFSDNLKDCFELLKNLDESKASEKLNRLKAHIMLLQNGPPPPPFGANQQAVMFASNKEQLFIARLRNVVRDHPFVKPYIIESMQKYLTIILAMIGLTVLAQNPTTIPVINNYFVNNAASSNTTYTLACSEYTSVGLAVTTKMHSDPTDGSGNNLLITVYRSMDGSTYDSTGEILRATTASTAATATWVTNFNTLNCATIKFAVLNNTNDAVCTNIYIKARFVAPKVKITN